MRSLSPQFSNILTKRAKNAIERSFSIAEKHPANNGTQATPLHLLYALYQEKGSVAANILNAHNLKQQHFSNYFEKNSSSAAKNTKKQKPNRLSASYKTALKKAANQAMSYGHPLIGTEHLLYGTITRLNTFEGIPANKIVKIKTHIEDIMQHSMPINVPAETSGDAEHFDPISFEEEIADLLEGKKSQEDHAHDMDEEIEDINTRIKIKKPEEVKTSILDAFCDDLTQKAKNKQLDPLVGREKELERMTRILVRRNKNNPLLVGDAGVGKTALAEGLAQKIADGKVPIQLASKKVLSLDLSSVLAGTVYRGEFEERMHDLIEEASSKDVILFMDEVHMLMGAGAAQGSLDAANILKPALARGEFQCIGATTHDEFKKSIEKDSALDRRFQKLIIKEQTREEALQTLKQLKPYYEKHHEVKIPNAILALCVDLSIRYMPSKALPDKALDILDEVASHARSTRGITKKEQELLNLDIELKKATAEKESATRKEHYKKALAAKNKEEALRKNIDALDKGGGKAKKSFETIAQDHVYQIMADMAGVPISSLPKDKLQEIQLMEKSLKANIVGQTHAAEKIISTIKRNQAGVRSATRPIGSFLFLGPSGSGKTFTAKLLASLMANKKFDLYSQPETLIRLDMSEFSEPHSIARLIGAPPGYVGYEESGSLIDRIKVNPYSVVLFDEIEKAHPQIFNILLQILEDGTLTDSQGKSADLRNTVVILTSNIGARDALKKDLGFSGFSDESNKKHPFIKSLREVMRPEIVNRLDDVVIFEKLGRQALKKIAQAHIKQLNSNIKGVASVQCKPDAYSWIVEKAEKEGRGARGIRKIIEAHVEDPLAGIILENPKNRKVVVSVKNNDLFISNAA